MLIFLLARIGQAVDVFISSEDILSLYKGGRERADEDDAAFIVVKKQIINDFSFYTHMA